MPQLLSRFLLLALVAIAAPLAAQTRGFAEASPPIDGRRIALVIGNSDYTAPGWARLTNASPDATLVSRRLTAARFEVRLVPNADWRTLTAELDAFATRARTADIALIYYGGHGFEFDGVPYLVPVDGPDRVTDTQVEERFVNFNRVLRAGASRGLSMLFIDACRSRGPVLAIAGAQPGRVAAFGPGETDSIVFYSTSPGQVAYDSAPPGEPNSPFAQAIGLGIDTPGMDLSMMFTRVADYVVQATQSRDPTQRPRFNGSLTRPFYFTPPERLSETAPGGATTDRLDIPLQTLATIDESTLISRVVARHSPAAIMRMAEAGDPVALYMIGYMLEFGFRLERSLPQARIWLERAAATGHPAGQLEYGYFLLNHGDGDTDRRMALDLYRRAAAQGYAKAMSHLASAIWTSDRDEGMRLLREAARLGDANALFTLAGQGERASSVAALQRLAAAGNVEGDRWLCELQDGEANALLGHCQRAAQSEAINAQARLALMLEEGRGAARNPSQARQWAVLALSRSELDAGLRQRLMAMLNRIAAG